MKMRGFGSRPTNRLNSMYVAITKLSTRYPFSTSTSHASRELGTFNRPMPGTRCISRSGRPTSTVTKSPHMRIAEIASNSPRITTSLIGFQ